MDLLVSLVWFLVEFKEKFEQQTTQWTKYVVQKDKQWSTIYYIEN